MRRVVILGGGFGGLTVAVRLAKRSLKDVEIVLCDKERYHVYTPWLYSLAAGFLDRYPSRSRQLRALARIPLDTLCKSWNIRFRPGTFSGFSKDYQSVIFEDGTTLRADIFVVALGGIAMDFGIPGVKKYAHRLKTFSDAEHLGKSIDLLAEDVRLKRVPSGSIAIIGAGPSGVEFSAECALRVRAWRERYNLASSALTCTLYDAGAGPVANFPTSVQEAVKKRLDALGVIQVYQEALREVEPHAIRTSGGRHEASLVVFMGGVGKNPESDTWGLLQDSRGRFLAEDTFLAKQHQHIFVLGDNARRESGGDPQSAQAATREASCVAYNVEALLRGHPIKSFRAPTWHVALALGGSYAVARIYLRCSGILGWAIRCSIDYLYFFSILPLRTWLRLSVGKYPYGTGSRGE